MKKLFTVYKLTECEDCDINGEPNGGTAIYTDDPLAAFANEQDAINFAKLKGENYFIINLKSGAIIRMGTFVTNEKL